MMKLPRLQDIPSYQPTLAVAIVILYLTLFPKPLGEEDVMMFPGFDKVGHFCMFGGMAGIFMYDRWRIGRPLGLRGAWTAVFAAIAFGAVCERLQFVMQLGRSGNDLWDILANTLGAIASLPVACWLGLLRK